MENGPGIEDGFPINNRGYGIIAEGETVSTKHDRVFGVKMLTFRLQGKLLWRRWADRVWERLLRTWRSVMKSLRGFHDRKRKKFSRSMVRFRIGDADSDFFSVSFILSYFYHLSLRCQAFPGPPPAQAGAVTTKWGFPKMMGFPNKPMGFSY